jgi:Putative peptidoglycan binding domain
LVQLHAAAAADDMSEFAIRGAGLVPCEVYNRERDARSTAYNVIASWMDGYITGVNQYARDTYDVASFETTELYAALVSEYCKKHPQTPVFAVINSLVKQDWNDRLRAPSQKVEVAIGGEKVFLYEEAIKKIQEKLKSRGYYRDGITGSYGPSVQDAMKAYQKSLRFKPTGFPDQATLWRLFNAPQ